MKILIVDDDPDLLSLVGFALAQSGFAVVKAVDVGTATRAFAAEVPDLAILDINLPGGSGFDICETIRRQSRIPIMMLTARGEEEDLVRALDLGADDYLTKPFDTDELLARVRVALRNRMTRGGGVPAVTAGDLSIDLMNRRITKAGKEVHLTPKEYAVLAQLAKFPGRVITHDQIMVNVWPNESERHVEYLRVLVRSLRQKLETDPQRPQIISNEVGIGYRLRLPEDAT